MLQFSLSPSSPVYVGGSRSLASMSPAWVAVQNFVQEVVGSTPSFVHVGCSTGADQAAILALAGSYQARVFSVTSHSGAGGWSGTASATVQRFFSSGGSVSFLAGGALSVPLKARLIRRSLAGLAGAGVAVFFAPGAGSLSVARHALKRGIPVLVWVNPAKGCYQKIAGGKPANIITFLGFKFWLHEPKQATLL